MDSLILKLIAFFVFILLVLALFVVHDILIKRKPRASRELPENDGILNHRRWGEASGKFYVTFANGSGMNVQGLPGETVLCSFFDSEEGRSMVIECDVLEADGPFVKLDVSGVNHPLDGWHHVQDARILHLRKNVPVNDEAPPLIVTSGEHLRGGL